MFAQSDDRTAGDFMFSASHDQWVSVLTGRDS